MSVFGAFMANQAAKQDGEITELRAERDKLEAQRDALLAVPREVVHLATNGDISRLDLPYFPTIGDWVRLAKQSQAAIEEAEK